jgi:hypothetical protein
VYHFWRRKRSFRSSEWWCTSSMTKRSRSMHLEAPNP